MRSIYTPRSSPLKVLQVITSMTADAGGPPLVCAGIAAALTHRGHSASIATTESPSENCFQRVSIDPNVTLHAFPRSSSSRYATSTSLNDWLTAHVREFDIVHLHSLWQFPAFAAAHACWRSRTPYVVTLHGMLDRYCVHQRSYWIKKAYDLFRGKRIHGRAAAIHCLNHAEIRQAVPWIANLPKFVVGNAISREELQSLPPRGQFRAAYPQLASHPIALFLSRLHPKKGLDRLIPVWRALADQMPELRLVIAGTGDPEYIALLHRLIAQHHLQDHILCIGQIVGPTKWQALVDADVFILPSHQEGFSMAITEALAAGCPVVATEECNFDELTEHRCGVVIKNGDMTAFAAAVRDLIRDPTTRAALVAAGRNLVARRFTWEQIAEELEAVYRFILAGKTILPALSLSHRHAPAPDRLPAELHPSHTLNSAC